LAGISSRDRSRAAAEWNFAKVLVDRTGQVAARFEPKTAPGAPEVNQAVEKAIGA
jgi:glutathione peroxidase